MFNPNVLIKNASHQAQVNAFVSLIARVLMAYIFIISGWGKVAGYQPTVAYMESMGVPGALLPLTILVELGGGLALLLGFQARLAALGLAIFSIVTAVIFHAAPAEAIHLMKNLAMAGGLLFLLLQGAGKISIDHMIEK